MKRSKLFLCIICGLSVASANAGMLPAGSNDLHAASVAKGLVSKPPIVVSDELHYAWRSDASIAAQPAFEAVSKEYWADYSAAQLNAGIDLHTTAPGAVVRISPMQGSSTEAIEPAAIQLQRDGQVYANASGLTSVASAADVAAGMPEFPEGSTAFRLRADLGSGVFRLSATAAEGRYLLHVFEPDSEQKLKLQAAKDSVLSGQPLTLNARFEGARGITAVDTIGGVLTAPDGRSFDLRYERQRDGSYQAALNAPAATVNDGPVLWEVHTFSSAGDVLRDAKTAVAITAPLARLNGNAERLMIRAHGTNVLVQFGVQSAEAIRLQLTGTLWGTNDKGALIPVANAQTAKSLSGASGDYLELRFMTDVIDPAGVRAPFEIRDLRLQNQADMGLLERRERAWTSD